MMRLMLSSRLRHEPEIACAYDLWLDGKTHLDAGGCCDHFAQAFVSFGQTRWLRVTMPGGAKHDFKLTHNSAVVVVGVDIDTCTKEILLAQPGEKMYETAVVMVAYKAWRPPVVNVPDLWK